MVINAHHEHWLKDGYDGSRPRQLKAGFGRGAYILPVTVRDPLGSLERVPLTGIQGHRRARFFRGAGGLVTGSYTYGLKSVMAQLNGRRALVINYLPTALPLYVLWSRTPSRASVDDRNPA